MKIVLDTNVLVSGLLQGAFALIGAVASKGVLVLGPPPSRRRFRSISGLCVRALLN